MIRLLVLLLVFWGTAQAQLSVVASLHPYASLLRQLAGDKAEVLTLLPVGASPHTYSPTPRDVATLAEADLIILNGGLDEWLLELVQASGTNAPVIEMLEALEVEPLEPSEDDPSEEAHEDHADEDHADEDHSEMHDHGGVNPHLWLDPQLMIQAVNVLASELERLDPENAQHYEEAERALVTDLTELDAEISKILLGVRGAAFVPFHDAWPYFARRYSLNLIVEIEPAPGREPSPRYLAEALELIRSSGAKAIFSDAQLPSRPAEVVAAEAGVPLFILDPEGGGSSAEQSYQEMMLENARTIARALGQP